MKRRSGLLFHEHISESVPYSMSLIVQTVGSLGEIIGGSRKLKRRLRVMTRATGAGKGRDEPVLSWTAEGHERSLVPSRSLFVECDGRSVTSHNTIARHSVGSVRLGAGTSSLPSSRTSTPRARSMTSANRRGLYDTIGVHCLYWGIHPRRYGSLTLHPNCYYIQLVLSGRLAH